MSTGPRIACIYGRFGFGADRRGRFGGCACTRLVPATRVQPPRPPTHLPCLRASTLPDPKDLLLDRVTPPTWTASSPDPATAWMAVAGSGLLPRKATLESSILPANRRQRRLPRSRTRPSTPLSENTTVHVQSPPANGNACVLVRGGLPDRVPDAARRSSSAPPQIHADPRATPAAVTSLRSSPRSRRPWRSRRSHWWHSKSAYAGGRAVAPPPKQRSASSTSDEEGTRRAARSYGRVDGGGVSQGFGASRLRRAFNPRPVADGVR